MKILHGLDGDSDTGLGDQERRLYVATCRSNVLDSISRILEARDSLGLNLSPSLSEACHRIRKAVESVSCDDISPEADISPQADSLSGLYTSDLARDVARLWQEVSVQTLLAGSVSQVTSSNDDLL